MDGVAIVRFARGDSVDPRVVYHYMSCSVRLVETTLVLHGTKPLLTPFTLLVIICLISIVHESGNAGYTTRTTLSNGYLGSGNDEERSEPRYVMRIAVLRESSNL